MKTDKGPDKGQCNKSCSCVKIYTKSKVSVSLLSKVHYWHMAVIHYRLKSTEFVNPD